MKGSLNVSFNDIQYVRQSDLFTILIRFRRYKFVAIMDVEKMYRQVIITEGERSLHKIVWSDNPDEHLKHYQLIAEAEHKIQLHCGPQQLFNSLRQSYWPLHGKGLTRPITHKCTICHKRNAKPVVQFMGNLPSSHVSPASPFSHVGVDLAGPFNTREKRAHSYKVYKTYISLLCVRPQKPYI